MRAPPPPPSAEKLALRGEPTARTLIQNLLLAADDKLKLRKLVETIAAARAYLSTRAPAEEALIEAGYAMRASRHAQTEADLVACVYRLPALPVEGRAPDASHEKKPGKKGGV